VLENITPSAKKKLQRAAGRAQVITGGLKMDRLLKVKEVAELFNISADRVYTLAREGIIPSVRLGRQLRFSTTALDKFIAEGGKSLPDRWKRE